MFGFKKKEDGSLKYKSEIKELKRTIEYLKDEKKDLSESVDRLKSKEKIKTEDIKHMVKMKMEKAEVENERARLGFERDCDKKIAKVKDDYRDKLEKGLVKQLDDMRSMYDSILKRLPDMTVRLGGKV